MWRREGDSDNLKENSIKVEFSTEKLQIAQCNSNLIIIRICEASLYLWNRGNDTNKLQIYIYPFILRERTHITLSLLGPF